MSPPDEATGADRVEVSAGWIGGSWRVLIDLDAGSVQRLDEEAPARRVVGLKRLRAEAARAHARGAVRVSEQHADGEVVFAITLDGTTVTHRHATWGGGRYEGLERLFACARSVV